MRLDLNYSTAQHWIFFESEAKYTITPKGRRVGATKGASNAFIEMMVEGKTLLWGDTINGNIDRYFERYFLPTLKKNNISHNWNAQKRLLKVGAGYTDFRSADRPENWEGFGYHVIFLNEAGIILKNRYLYENAVLPMMMDFKDSRLIAAGVPKGKRTKNNEKAKFFELWENVLEGKSGYAGRTYTPWENPWLRAEDIDALKNELPSAVHAQEIYGQFVEGSGTLFEGVHHYDVLPTQARCVIGLDTAYTQSTQADATVAVIFFVVADVWYIAHVESWRADITYTIPKLKKLDEKYGGVIHCEANGPQKAVYDILAANGLRLKKIIRTKDKFSEAQSFALAWNSGKILLPRQAEWLNGYLSEIHAFTGIDDFADDQLDASVNGYETLVHKPYTTLRTPSRYG